MNVNFSQDGLIPCIAQDANTGEVLMLAYMSQEAFEKTRESGSLWFWSRSKQRLWQKGESSGNTLIVTSLKLDCDKDTLLALVEPQGPACHTGETSCFFNEVTRTDDSRNYRFDDRSSNGILNTLNQLIEQRLEEQPDNSYIIKLTNKGENQVLKKVGEEATELVTACKDEDKKEIIHESADLIFHTLLALKYFQVDLSEVLQELHNRHADR
ncbi:bifunctional phosphoribosyl-AMP cyclohydrolase/phosphoribosyl-ATP diphosphatase HisIE [Natranaerobius thermophilus]|uniref:Histidine biosynthesis bifunctional protein HisIE n=1 Tax=Natranaerobius thermophilus (strain ATCC BAA-1301 / DSM 18059 / JW/NM-WN-LF) TaxID=457570 RepID=B2A6W9_NATTJ|nr:bifunctional phosphoribosyl-AMP cyclohydrolase/phosphoribosyl-ATP diphosphatase HisIE [Natranaerobius thermophilus]ACB85563.1 phosphoribosyl-ATP diphosphatase [Natranaerobius thermophilus JW/NM-WN-LF]